MSNAAIRSCDLVGGEHLGYIADPSTCRYDPTQDPEVLCAKDGGTNNTEACVSRVQARAFNKFWYGQTTDGTVPPPTTDNGFDTPIVAKRWYGLTRGTNLGWLAGEKVFPIAAEQVALSLQDPSLATSGFRSAAGKGEDGWKKLSYQDLAQAVDAGLDLQEEFAHIETDNPDLDAFRSTGGKILLYHGWNDELIMPQGSSDYYRRVIDHVGGLEATQDFFRYYLVPGMGHGFSNGTSNSDANPPLPTNRQLFDALVAWVEDDIPPARMKIVSQSDKTVSGTLCPYPQKAHFVYGDPRDSLSYICAE